MSAFDVIYVEIQRSTKVKLPDLSMTETFGPIPGSPEGGWPCLYYRRKQNYQGPEKAEAGRTVVDNQQVLSVQVPGADIREGDIALLPPGTASSRPERARVQRTRNYDDGVQCDIETGAAGKATH